MLPKYARPEIERRWLVHEGQLPSLSALPRRRIEDKYLDGGRLRLRAVHGGGSETTLKLGKKYARSGNEPEHVVSIYLSEEEYRLLLALPGAIARKARYAFAGGSLDIYSHPNGSPAIFEVEFQSEQEAAAFEPPAFVSEEVTGNANYSGFSLARNAL